MVAFIGKEKWQREGRKKLRKDGRIYGRKNGKRREMEKIKEKREEAWMNGRTH